jgi:hypothetical protein
MPRFLISGEMPLIQRLPNRYELSERLLKDRLLAQVAGVDVVGFGGVLFPSSTTQVLGCEITAGTLADADGVPVRATLCLDDHDQLFELELWKMDFSPIIDVDLRGAFSDH